MKAVLSSRSIDNLKFDKMDNDKACQHPTIVRILLHLKKKNNELLTLIWTKENIVQMQTLYIKLEERDKGRSFFKPQE